MSLAQALLTGDPGYLPSRREEAWRWTDLRGLIRVLPPPAPAFCGDLPLASFAAPFPTEEVVIVDGQGPTGLDIPAGETRRISLRLINAAAGAGHVGRVRVSLEAGARAVLLQTHEALAGGYVGETQIDISLGDGARLERLVLADDREDAVSVTISDVRLARGAVFNDAVLTTGARRQRLETRLTHAAGESEARLLGLYRLAGRRHADLTSLIEHESPGSASDQLVKGTVDGQSRAVFQGRILVRPGADRTDARMGHHALVLSDTAEVDAKPELEIYADDVSCAHGNTVGTLDDEALFYLRQRGMSEARARAFLTEAYVSAVLDGITDQDLQTVARAWLAREAAP